MTIFFYLVIPCCRTTDEANMQVSDREISVYAESCQSEICEENCLKAVSFHHFCNVGLVGFVICGRTFARVTWPLSPGINFCGDTLQERGTVNSNWLYGCFRNCRLFQECKLCNECQTVHNKFELKRAYLEHHNRKGWKRVMPKPFQVTFHLPCADFWKS